MKKYFGLINGRTCGFLSRHKLYQRLTDDFFPSCSSLSVSFSIPLCLSESLCESLCVSFQWTVIIMDEIISRASCVQRHLMLRFTYLNPTDLMLFGECRI